MQRVDLVKPMLDKTQRLRQRKVGQVVSVALASVGRVVALMPLLVTMMLLDTVMGVPEGTLIMLVVLVRVV